MTLALIFCVESAILSFSPVYPGNQGDLVTFSELIFPLTDCRTIPLTVPACMSRKGKWKACCSLVD